MPQSTPFPCDTCGWGGTHHCVVGKIDSPVWIKQIPLGRWHAARRNKLKNLKEQNQKDNA